jgi:GntR family transcriptional regulator, transcriptional repressor for pyruvate dehydrogenase complex
MRPVAIEKPSARLNRSRVADQIVDDLRGQILSGALPDGARLPSEQDLAGQYGVSGPTIREAIRVLAAMGLLSTRNGSRTVVTARGDDMLVMSLASVSQFAKISAVDVLGLLGELNAYAIKLAAEHASDADIARLRAATAATAEVAEVESGSAALKHYFTTLSEISHNPLLAALCRAITDIQMGLAVELSGGSAGDWGQIAASQSLYAIRVEIAQAIAERDAPRAVKLIRDYHGEVIARIQSLPRARELRESDPGLKAFLAAWLGANVSISGRS